MDHLTDNTLDITKFVNHYSSYLNYIEIGERTMQQCFNLALRRARKENPQYNIERSGEWIKGVIKA